MCGIAGWVDFHRDLSGEDAILQAMADTLACRGPDAQGFYRSKEAAFAHRRLAVIDLEGGKQPMVRRVPGAATNGAGDSVVLTYSGEVYNFVELRMDLAGLGHPFETRSDTEVVLRAYLQWGPACVERFNGMFAFGIWDGAKRELFLARDRLGVKPLFYALTRHGILFGSEPKAILAHPGRTVGGDRRRTRRHLRVRSGAHARAGNLPHHPRAPPRALLVFSDKDAHVSRYWQLQSRPHTDDVNTTAAKVRDLLEDTVRRQLISDVPVCTLLSGGLDSSARSRRSPRARSRDEGRGPVHTYTIDFEGSHEDFTPSRDSTRARRALGEEARQVHRHGAPRRGPGYAGAHRALFHAAGRARLSVARGHRHLAVPPLPGDQEAPHGGGLGRVRGRDLRRLPVVLLGSGDRDRRFSVGRRSLDAGRLPAARASPRVCSSRTTHARVTAKRSPRCRSCPARRGAKSACARSST